MIHELAPLRMALDAYDAAETRHEREVAQRAIYKLLCVSVVRILVAAVDDPARPDEDEEETSEP